MYFLTFNYVDHIYSQRGRAKDPVAYLHDVEQRARERQVAYETVRILRQRVRVTLCL